MVGASISLKPTALCRRTVEVCVCGGERYKGGGGDKEVVVTQKAILGIEATAGGMLTI